ncbi:hypothetical protein C5B73_20570 [Nocardia cyriacigeorgica]|nr:hypothetical protein C5B73_20570 [Nocardia cyriacigeorgica]
MVHGGGARSTATHPCGEAGDDIGRTFVVGGGHSRKVPEPISDADAGAALEEECDDLIEESAQIAGNLRYAP